MPRTRPSDLNGFSSRKRRYWFALVTTNVPTCQRIGRMTIRHEATSGGLMRLFLCIDNNWHTAAESTLRPMPVNQSIGSRLSLFHFHNTNRHHSPVRHIKRPRNHFLRFIFFSISAEV